MRFLKKMFWCLFVWTILPASEEELAGTDAIVTQSCGRTIDGEADPGNLILAQVARGYQDKYHLPLLVQEELMMADPDLNVVSVAMDSSGDGASTLEWNTRQIAEFQVELCRKMGWQKVIVVALPDHMGRSVRVYEKLGMLALVACMPKGRYLSQCHQQLLCRFPWLFRLRETGVRLLFWKLGYI